MYLEINVIQRNEPRIFIASIAIKYLTEFVAKKKITKLLNRYLHFTQFDLDSTESTRF